MVPEFEAGVVAVGVAGVGVVLGVVGEEGVVGVEGEAAAETATDSFMPPEQWPVIPQM